MRVVLQLLDNAAQLLVVLLCLAILLVAANIAL